MYSCSSFLLLAACLLCISKYALAAPSSNSSGLSEREKAKLSARGNPYRYDSVYNDEKQLPGNVTNLSRNNRRQHLGDEYICTSLETNRYISRDLLKPRVDEFCDDAAKQGKKDKDSGSITRAYYKDTKEEVHISLKILHDDKPDHDDCIKTLMVLTDSCNNPDAEWKKGKKNPHNVKAGGIWEKEKFIYRIRPEHTRGSADEAYVGGCRCEFRFFTNSCKIWGHGWATLDGGARIREEVGACALWRHTWAWGILKPPRDGTEWTGAFETSPSQKDCVKWALIESGAPRGITCTGSGT